MKFVRVLYVFICACLAVTAMESPTSAARLFFSSTAGPTGSPLATPDTLPTVPSLMLAPGATGTLHVWLQVDPRVSGQPATNQNFLGVAYDVQSSNTAVGTAMGSTVVNPGTLTVDGDPGGPNRWAGIDGGQLNQAGGIWIRNAFGAALQTPGVTNSPSAMTRDPNVDEATRSWYIGSVEYQVAPGAANGSRTGLYFRVGSAETTLAGAAPTDPAIGAPLQFGASTTVHNGLSIGAGDTITGDLAEADAIIQVMGGTIPDVSATITPHALGDLTPGIALLNASPRGTFVNVTPNVSAGQINVNNFHGENSGNLTVFFDLVNDAQAAELVADLNAIVGRAFTASLSNFVGVNPVGGRTDGDIALTFTGAGGVGSSQFINFDFGAGVNVQAVGIPEPSTYALASLALAATAVYARRRRAA